MYLGTPEGCEDLKSKPTEPLFSSGAYALDLDNRACGESLTGRAQWTDATYVKVNDTLVPGAPVEISLFTLKNGCWKDEEEAYGNQAHRVCVASAPWDYEGHIPERCYYRFDKPDSNGKYLYLGAPMNRAYVAISKQLVAAGEKPMPDYFRHSTFDDGKVYDSYDLGNHPSGPRCNFTCPATPPPPPNDTYYGPNVIIKWPSIPGLTHGCPLVLASDNTPLDFKVEFTGNPVDFDFYGDGRRPLLDWIKPSGSFLALDLDGNGSIDSGRELFGVATILSSTGARASDGFEALAQYDSNDDNTIDAKDSVYGRLLVWTDRNGNGVSETSELRPLSKTNVTEIDLNRKVFERDPAKTAQSSYVDAESDYTVHPLFCGAAQRKIFDVWFAMKP